MIVQLLAWDEPRNASARCRIFDLAEWLSVRGVDARVDAPVGGALGDLLARPGRRPAYRGLQWLRASSRLRRAGQADVVVLQRELFPFGPPSLERRLLHSGRPVIFDLDDAMHVRPEHFRVASHALHHFGKSEEIARAAHAVVASSAELAAWAQSLNSRVTLVPTPVDVARFKPDSSGASRRAPGEPLVVGWTGTAGNLSHLESIQTALALAARQVPFRLCVIGERAPANWTAPDIDFIPWSLERESREVPRFDVGLMPLVDSPYARAKAGYKALVYMACGVPPIVSPVGTNLEILDDEVEGFFASSAEEWTSRLVDLLRSEERRRAMGARARQRVVRERSQDALFPRWLTLLKDLSR